MTEFINKMERKYGRYAIKNLIVYLLVFYVIGYLLFIVSPQAYTLLQLSPELVMKGQVWRLVSWVCTVPDDFSFWIIFMFMFQYYVGRSLENVMGAFKYNLYVFSGIIFMTLSSMIIFWVTGISMSPSTYYINMASFLAYALCFPDLQVLFMMIIPIKVKWLAIADLIYMGYEFIAVGSIRNAYAIYGEVGLRYANQYIWATRVGIVVSILNFIIFFFMTRNTFRFRPREIKRKVDFKRKVAQAGPKIGPKHRCAICGRTEEDNDELTFRYCSKCNGNYEFCNEHLYTHKHFE